MLSNIVHRDELKRRLKEARLWVEIVDRGLSVLDDEERLVLDYCYIHKVKGSLVLYFFYFSTSSLFVLQI